MGPRRSQRWTCLGALLLTAASSCASLKDRLAKMRSGKTKIVNGRVIAASDLNPGVAMCVQRTEGFLGRSFSEEQKQSLCRSAALEEPSAPLTCFEKASDVIPGVTLTDDQRIQLCGGVSFEPMAPIDCVDEANEALGKDLSPSLKVQLCAGAPEEQTSPIVCFDRAEALLGKSLKTAQKVKLCSGADQSGLAPLQCYSRADQVSGSKLNDDEKIRICSREDG